jgi:hypothetical protein
MTLAELVVKFRADTATFATDVAKAKDLSFDSSKHIVQSFKTISTAIAGVAVSMAAMGAAMVMHAVKSADEMMKLSRAVGVGVESLSAYSYAAGLAGLDTETLGKALGRLDRNAAEAAGGTGKAASAFKRLGISLTDPEGKLRSTSDLILDVAEKFSKMEDGSTKTALAMQLFGRDGARMVTFLNQGKEGLRAATEEARRLGKVIDEETGRAAEEFHDNLERLEGAVGGFGIAMMRDALPALQNISQAMVDAAKEGRGFQENINGLDISLRVLATVAVAVYEAIERVGISFGVSFRAAFEAARGNVSEAVSIMAWGENQLKLLSERVAVLYGKIWAEPGKIPARTPAGRPPPPPPDDKAAKAAAEAQTRYNESLRKLREELTETSPALRHYNETLADLAKLGHGVDTTQAQMAAAAIVLRDRDKEVAEGVDALNKGLREQIPLWQESAVAAALYKPPVPPATEGLEEYFRRLGFSTAELREEFIRTFALGLPQSLDIARDDLAIFGEAFVSEISTAEMAMQAFRYTAGQAFEQVSEAMGHSIAMAIVYKESIGAAMAAATKAALANIAGEAIVRALQSAALGFYLLATWDFAGAANAFTAAAIWGSIGGVAAGMGRALPGGTAGGSSPYAVTGAGGTAAGVITTPASERETTQIIRVELPSGGLWSSDMVRDLIEQINTETHGSNVVLYASVAGRVERHA